MATSLRWPALLPQSMPLETERRSPPNFIETAADIGPKIRRRRFTAVPEYLTPPEWVFTEEQYNALDYFYRTTLVGGSLTFMWTSPLENLGDVECRFVEPYSAKVTIPGSSATRRWTLQMKLEVLP